MACTILRKALMQTPEEPASEVDLWRDFVIWWENKHARPAQGRILEALADAEARYQEVLAANSLVNAVS